MTTPAPTAPPPAPAVAAEPLGRRFHALLGATTAANLGDGIIQTAVPLYAVTLTREPGPVALVTAAVWLPWLLLGIVGGVVVDRHDRRTVQVLALTARAVLLAGAVALAVTGRMSITALVLLVLAYGATDVLADLAQSALVPDVVPRSRLQAANGRVLAVQQVAGSFVGGPVGGALLTLGAGWAFGVPAGLAVLAVVTLLRGVRGRFRHAPAEAPDAAPGAAGAPARRALHEVREGVGFLLRHPVLRPLLVAGAVANMCFTGYTAVFVLWAVGDGSRVGMSAAQYPLLGVAMGLGAVLGSLVVERLLRHVGELRVLLGGWAAMSALLVVPVLAPSPWAVGAAFFLTGFSNTLSNVLSASMRQRLVPASMLGRVGGAGRTLAFGLMPVGALLAGAAAGAWGLAPVLLAAAVLSLAGLAYPAATVRQRTVAAAELPAPDPVSRAGRGC
jgi:MFS family permease